MVKKKYRGKAIKLVEFAHCGLSQYTSIHVKFITCHPGIHNHYTKGASLSVVCKKTSPNRNNI